LKSAVQCHFGPSAVLQGRPAFRRRPAPVCIAFAASPNARFPAKYTQGTSVFGRFSWSMWPEAVPRFPNRCGIPVPRGTEGPGDIHLKPLGPGGRPEFVGGSWSASVSTTWSLNRIQIPTRPRRWGCGCLCDPRARRGVFYLFCIHFALPRIAAIGIDPRFLSVTPVCHDDEILQRGPWAVHIHQTRPDARAIARELVEGKEFESKSCASPSVLFNLMAAPLYTATRTQGLCRPPGDQQGRPKAVQLRNEQYSSGGRSRLLLQVVNCDNGWGVHVLLPEPGVAANFRGGLDAESPRL